jgi:hypothetical protein
MPKLIKPRILWLTVTRHAPVLDDEFFNASTKLQGLEQFRAWRRSVLLTANLDVECQSTRFLLAVLQ